MSVQQQTVFSSVKNTLESKVLFCNVSSTVKCSMDICSRSDVTVFALDSSL